MSRLINEAVERMLAQDEFKGGLVEGVMGLENPTWSKRGQVRVVGRLGDREAMVVGNVWSADEWLLFFGLRQVEGEDRVAVVIGETTAGGLALLMARATEDAFDCSPMAWQVGQAVHRACKQQPNPTAGANSRDVFHFLLHERGACEDYVLERLKARRQCGVESYGVSLHTHNGRDALLDLEEELLDAMAYATQKALEGPAHIEAEFLDLVDDLEVMVHALQHYRDDEQEEP